MKFIDFAKARLLGISDAVVRYFTVFVLLVSIAVLNGIAIETDTDMEKHILSLVFGVFSFLLAHAIGERFAKTSTIKSLYLGGALIVTAAYYAYLLNISEIGDVVMIRTITLMFALFVAYIWVPSVKRETDFNAVFLSVFKAFFTSVFFSGIIYGGVSMIILAINELLFEIDTNAYGHTANVIWIVFAPMLMLSLVPVFTEKKEHVTKTMKAISYPKFLEMLLTYVLIPIASVYTLVLVIYMGKTIALLDWEDNLLEPLLLSYLIAVILIYVLVKRLGNALTKFFVRVFPALITLIAAFQLTASIIKANDEGVVASRYYVLAFSVYSIIIGVLLFLYPKKNNGYVAAFAVIFALVCASPLFGAVDVSIRNQSAIIERTLEKNGMLNGDVITPKSEVSEEDRNRIFKGIEYLYRIDAIDSVNFLPEDFNPGLDFQRVLGFDPYGYGMIDKLEKTYSIYRGLPVDTSGYDYLIVESIFLPKSGYNMDSNIVTAGEKEYRLELKGGDNDAAFIIYEGATELLSVSLNSMTDAIADYADESGEISSEKLTFNFDNSSAKMRIVFRSISMYSYSEHDNGMNAEILILFSIK